MNPNTIKTVAILSASTLIVLFLSLVFRFFDIDDSALKMALASLFSAGTGIDFHARLQKKYGASNHTA